MDLIENSTSLSVLSRLIYESLSITLLQYIEEEKVKYTPNRISELCGNFVGMLEKSQAGDGHDFADFLQKENLSPELAARSEGKLRISLEPYVKKYLEWLPIENRVFITGQFLDQKLTVWDFIKKNPDFTVYMNSETRNALLVK